MNDTDDAHGGVDRTRRRVLTTAGLVGATALAGCLGGSGSGTDTESGGMGDGGTSTDATMGGDGTATDGMMGSGTDAGDAMGGETDAGGMDGDDTGGEMGTDSESMASGWLGRELTDVTTGETFTVGQFDGPVVLETFAVWCPTCTAQQETLGELRSRMGEDVTVVSLNIDPNEDASKVRSHAADHGFDWRYAVSPPELTQRLVDEFGSVVTSAPSAPVVVVCPDGSAQLIDQRGVKSADTIANRIENC